MSEEISRLEPREVWGMFTGLAGVPRPSKREEKIRAHIHDLAARHGLKARQDDTGNIVVDVPASEGKENAPTIVLQGHLDMVCEKNEGTVHDFDNDPIRLLLKQENGERFVRADGTTLGADNGMGVALALAAATSEEVVHGPLELLLTTDEEQGMTGAKALVPDSFQGRILINLDSEEDNALYIGCAGGCDTTLDWEFATEPSADLTFHEVRVRGLRGGHSGCDIHENRGNAIQLLARALSRTAAKGEVRIARIRGGNLRNAIPREASAIVAADSAALEQAAKEINDACRAESFEHELEVSVSEATDGPATALGRDDSRTLLDALVAIPSGVISMHPKIPELVQNSNNLSVLRCEEAGGRLKLSADCLSRSASLACLEFDKNRLAAIGRATGARVEHSGQYSGWDPDVDSALLATCKKVYRDCFGEDAKIAAIHAGLECGIIGDRVGGGVDMISFGPNITGAHSPAEQVSVESVEKIWRYLKAVLAALAK